MRPGRGIGGTGRFAPEFQRTKEEIGLRTLNVNWNGLCDVKSSQSVEGISNIQKMIIARHFIGKKTKISITPCHSLDGFVLKEIRFILSLSS
jgi:hypothetical protein